MEVTVTTPVGISALNPPADQYIFEGVPTVTAVNPGAGTTAAGTTVVITGTNFTATSQVSFGGANATGVVVNSPTQLTVTAPAHVAGQVDVQVTTPVATSAVAIGDGYIYDGVPTVTALTPAAGGIAGGNTVTITGTGFLTATGVSFGATVVSPFTINSDATITVAAPAGAGTVDVTVTNPTGTSTVGVADKYAYQGVPTVTSVSPAGGRLAGGATVVVTGTSFNGASQVMFGTSAALAFTVNSSTQITVTTPPEAAGTVDVTVTTPIGISALNPPSDQYSFDGAPTVTGVSPGFGTATGGTAVVVTGTGFRSETAVTFGLTIAGTVTVNSDTQLTVTTPAHAAGQVDVTVTNTTGTSPVAIGDGYIYDATPTVTAVTPPAGTVGGGASVTITGTGFLSATAVNFGATAAVPFTINSDATITVNAPAHVAGLVDVRVTNPGGTSPTGVSDNYTYEGAPTVTAVSPAGGPLGGGATVVVTGTNLSGASQVMFGATTAVITANTATQITVTTPPGAAGSVDVTVTTPVGISALNAPADQYTFEGAPTVTSVTPNAGRIAGGTTVVIAGTNFTGATQVTLGGTPATITANTATSITVTTPVHVAGQVDVTVTTPAGTSVTGAADKFTYDGTPTVTAVAPIVGLPAGGTAVTVTGSGFLTATGVKFGAVAAAAFTINSDTSITATTAAGTGTVDVTVVNPTGTSAVNGADHYTFEGVPTVTGVTPAFGPAVGGASVTVAGTNFTAASQVSFGGTNATITSNTGTSITVTTPVHGAGQVDVTVTTPIGTSVTGAADKYTYDTTPTVTAVAPLAGTTAGGTTVTVTGTGFLSATAVRFAATAGTIVTINSDTSITVTAPARGAGQVDVTVINPTGTSATGAADKYTYDAMPTVTAVTPIAGTTVGGATVTITGTGFLSATAVKFGANAATIVSITSDTQLSVTTPAGGAGAVDVQVTNVLATSALNPPGDRYTYEGNPTVTGVNPIAGSTAGSTTVVIAGTNFTGASQVRFGTTAATGFTVNSATQITATTPLEAAATVDVTVTTPVGISSTSAADNFTFEGAPTVTTVAPATGALAGGNTVTITGTNFTGASGVTFGGTAATAVTFISATQITVTAPARAAGQVDVVVTTPAGTSAVVAADHYTYAVTTVTGINPAFGPAAGGTVVTLTGTNFTAATQVSFGATPATAYTVNSATSITATAPAHAAGQVDITVTTGLGTSATSAADQFTFDATPTVTAVLPASGRATGGTTITITGTGFLSATGVKVNGVSATGVTIGSDTSITAVTPAGAPSIVDVQVTNPTGTSAVAAGDKFTYNAPPTATITFPSAPGYTGAQWDAAGTGCDLAGSTICGTASSSPNTIVGSVAVSIQLGAGNYWNGTAFTSATPVFIAATGTTAWSYIFPSGDFAAGTYTIGVQVTDAQNAVSLLTTTTVTMTGPFATPAGYAIQGVPQTPTDSKPDTGDQILYTYNQAMSSTSILAGWNGASTPVTASFSRVGGSTTLTITSGAATGLGTVTLGDAASRYLAGGTATETATMVMATVNGRSVVTVTFTSTSGALAAGPNNTTLTWTPSATAKNPAGIASGIGPITESAAPKQNF